MAKTPAKTPRAAPPPPPVWVKLRSSPEERAAWLAKAHDAGLTLAALMRTSITDAKVTKRRRVTSDPALLRSLAQIGNNLNQLARWANRDKAGVEALAVIARLIEIDRELAALRASVEHAAKLSGESPRDDD